MVRLYTRRMTLVRSAAFVVFLLPTLALADEALIWSSETTEGKAQAQLERARSAIPATGLVLSEGWPRIIKSADYIGLKPGYFVVLLGVCPDANTALPLLLRAKSAQRVAYTRTVEAPRDARCPQVDSRIEAKPVPGWVVVATGANKAQLEQRANSYSTTAVALAGRPDLLDTKGLKFAVPPGRKAERYLLVIGVCDLVDAEVIAAAVSDRTEAWVAWALEDPPMACPTLAASGVDRALKRAVALGDTSTIARYAPQFTGARSVLFGTAIEALDVATTRALLQAWGPVDATQAMGALLSLEPTEPARVKARTVLLDELTKAGVKPGSRAIDLTIYQRNLNGLRATLDAGARPAGELPVWVAHWPEGFKLLWTRGLVPAEQVGELLVTAQSDVAALEGLLALGVPAGARTKKGVGALDLALLFPGVLGQQNLLSREPALAAAAAGDVEGAVNGKVQSPGGWTPLLVAVATGQTAVVRALLAAGASASSRVTFTGNPLEGIDAVSLAIDRGDAALVELLVKAGADLTATSGSCCEETLQSEKWRLNRVRAWKELKHFRPAAVAIAELRGWGDGNYETYRPVQLTPLARAATLGRAELVKLLLDAGAPLDVADARLGLTPLMLAGQAGHWKVVEALVARGAALKTNDVSEHSGFAHLLRGAPPIDLVRKLLKKDKELAKGKGAVIAASLFGNLEVLDAVLKAGGGKGGEGDLAASLACETQEDDFVPVVERLKEAGFGKRIDLQECGHHEIEGC